MFPQVILMLKLKSFSFYSDLNWRSQLSLLMLFPINIVIADRFH
jgi:hypothetical protein